MSFVHLMDLFDASAWPHRIKVSMGLTAGMLVDALDDLGLRPLVGHDLHRIRRHHLKHPEDMKLSPPFDPERHPNHGRKDSVVIAIENSVGEEVGICGGRLFWVENTLATSINEIFPGSPIITAPSAHNAVISCFTAWSGAAHVMHKDRALFKAMERLLHLWILAHWHWSWLAGIAEEAPMRLAGNKIYGFPIIEQGLWTAGREYWLMLAHRTHCRGLITAKSYSDLSQPLGVPVVERASV